MEKERFILLELKGKVEDGTHLLAFRLAHCGEEFSQGYMELLDLAKEYEKERYKTFISAKSICINKVCL